MDALLAKWKKKLRPTATISLAAQKARVRIQSALNKAGLDATCTIGGSVAKGTHLRDAADVDLFIRFASTYKSGELSDLAYNAISPVVKLQRLHGSRDYFQFEQAGITFEVVPVLRIDSPNEAKNVTDMSPLHVDWIRRRLNAQPELADEIRLAKQFCKSARIYGAESYVSGFSGHILDILTVVYGSFVNLLEQASQWNDRAIIDIEGHHVDPLAVLNASKIVSPLIVVDPIQPDRNAAAALSKDKFVLFKQKATAFLAHPRDEFFIISPISISTLQKRYAKSTLLLLNVTALPQKKDVAGAKILKSFTHMREQLELHGFSTLDANWQLEPKPLIYFALKREVLPALVEHPGPPTHAKKHVEAFKAKHKNTRIKQGRVVATLRRQYRTPRALVLDLLASPYIKERVAKVSISTRSF